MSKELDDLMRTTTATVSQIARFRWQCKITRGLCVTYRFAATRDRAIRKGLRVVRARERAERRREETTEVIYRSTP